MSYIGATYLLLNGTINVGSVNTRNLDAQRDHCKLRLDTGTGGVFVIFNDATHYISPVAIMSVELDQDEVPYVLGHLTGADRPVKKAPQIEHMARKDASTSELPKAQTLADEVLSEFAPSDDKPARKSRRKAPTTP